MHTDIYLRYTTGGYDVQEEYQPATMDFLKVNYEDIGTQGGNTGLELFQAKSIEVDFSNGQCNSPLLVELY